MVLFFCLTTLQNWQNCPAALTNHSGFLSIQLGFFRTSRGGANNGVLQFNTLYIAIYRLQEHGYISPSETVVTESNRTRVYFSITEQGSRYLDDIIAEYRRVTQTIDSLLSKDGVLYEGDSV